MYDKPVLGLAQVQAAMAAMLEEAGKHPDLPVAIAIVDDAGDILGYAKMDRCRRGPQRLAIKKAYTSALRGMDSQAFVETLKEQGRSVVDFSDPTTWRPCPAAWPSAGPATPQSWAASGSAASPAGPTTRPSPGSASRPWACSRSFQPRALQGPSQRCKCRLPPLPVHGAGPAPGAYL